MSEPLTPEERVRAALQYLRGFPRQIGPFEWAWSPHKRGAYVPFEDAVDALANLTTTEGTNAQSVWRALEADQTFVESMARAKQEREQGEFAPFHASALDVERLARALEQAEVGCLGFGGFHGGNDPETAHRRDAEAVAREYATLTRHRGKE